MYHEEVTRVRLPGHDATVANCCRATIQVCQGTKDF
jgi:hypothetical protein